MPDLYRLARPILWSLPAETAHHIALRALRAGLGVFATSARARRSNPPSLAQRLWGLEFPNPIGIAAGFDKDGLVPEQILRLGFGHVEIGTVTPRPQHGNPGPRLFRLDRDKAIINRMGFPSAGLDVVMRRLSRRRPGRGIPRRGIPGRGIIGVNLGKNRDSDDPAGDYAEGIRRVAGLADYIAINISSPNTPGLRDLQRREPLEALLRQVLAARSKTGARPPLLLKIAPDLSPAECADIASVALASGIDGIIVANTTVTRPKPAADAGQQAGGLSGPPLFDLSTRVLAEMYRHTGGHIPLIGVGGISSAEDAYAKIRAGASLVQLHTALIFEGMNVVDRIKQGLAALLASDGFAHVNEAVGSAAAPAVEGAAWEVTERMPVADTPAEARPSFARETRSSPA